jgi:nucleoside-diphosphate-sugar epimerase
LSGVVQAARAGQEIAIYNPDAPYNNAVHVTELCCFIVDLLEQERTGHDVVTLGAGGVTTVRKAVETLLHAFGSASPVRVMSGSELPSFTISSKRAEERYGYRALDIETMLRRFAAENSNPKHAANRYVDDPGYCADGGNG